MPRDLFGDVTRPSVSIGNRKWYTVPISLLSHSAIVGVLIALPILAPALMPSVFTKGIESPIMNLVPPTPPPPPRLRTENAPPNPDAAPRIVPDGITQETIVDRQPFEHTVPGIIGGADNVDLVLAPPPQPVPPPVPQGPVRVGTGVRTPVKMRGSDPVYPSIAQAARVQGIVIIEATIGANGRVENARVLRSIPLLDQAALEAVRSWEYTPTLLNGVPVPVIMTVTVSFTLSR